LFTLGSVLKMTKWRNYLFSRYQLWKKWLGDILSEFIANLFGHPVKVVHYYDKKGVGLHSGDFLTNASGHHGYHVCIARVEVLQDAKPFWPSSGRKY
jgi:hypothetical protein